MRWPVLGRIWLFTRNARDSLWFIPALLVLCAIALALTLLRVDAHLERTGAPTWWLFAGNADSARAILSVVAGSLITVVAVTFSVTIIAIQQASTQYSPRILRTFTRDRGNQVVLGTYIATFVYALLVLRRVREGTSGVEGFLPAISITTAVVLALISFGLLVYFIHHVAQSLQVSIVLSAIAREVRQELSRHFPKRIGQPSEPPRTFDQLLAEGPRQAGRHECAIRAPRSGYVRIIDADAIERVGRHATLQAAVFVAIGDYVQDGEVIARVFAEDPLPQSRVDTFQDAFGIDDMRTVELDPAFGIRQIVDIALKALSPGINDPSTATQCLDHLGNVVASLLDRDLPSSERKVERSRILFRVPSFEDYLDASFAAIRHNARAELEVIQHFVRVLEKLGQRVEDPLRARALGYQLDELAAALDWEVFTAREQRSLRERIAKLAGELGTRGSRS
jgi:uncharacterized membrane protein